MLTFDGKALSFQPGREVVNKEPPTNKFVVEKLYKVHRQRMVEMEPVVDCHVDIPDFLTNQSWKQITEQHRRDVITKQNEVIYKRIAKAENTESLITTENRTHIKRVEHELLLMKRLKQMGRIRDILKVQRENEDLLCRIDKARPAYGAKSIRDWYRHHELFKEGRRSDPVAGHLGFRGCKGLFPKALPPVESPTQRSVNAEKAQGVFGAGYVETGRSPYKKKENGMSPSPRKMAPLRSPISRGNRELPYPVSPFSFGSVADPMSLTMDGDDDEDEVINKMVQNLEGSHDYAYNGINSPAARIPKKSPSSKKSASKKRSTKKLNSKEKNTTGGSDKKEKQNTNSLDGKSTKSSTTAISPHSTKTYSRLGTPSTSNFELNMDGLEVDGFLTIYAKKVAVPFQDKSIIVQMMLKRSSSDVMTIYCREVHEPYTIISEKETPMDKIYDLVNTQGTSSIFSDSAILSDIGAMKETFHQMFREVDDDGNGYLTFDEFMNLMQKANLGIDQENLRKILLEADDNGNGVVEIDEFYPLILDMTLSYRTVNAAREIVGKRQQIIDEEVTRRMVNVNLDEDADQLLMKIAGCDPKNSGVVRFSDVKRCLIAMSAQLHLTEDEIAMIQRMLPVEGYARVNYSTIPEVFMKVKWITCRHRMQSDLGTDIYKYCLRKCEEINLRPNEQGEMANEKGLIKMHELTEVLNDSEMFELNTIQKTVLIGEAQNFLTNGDLTGEDATLGPNIIDYQKVLPTLTKGIELMLDPDMLRQRAELLDPELGNLSGTSLIDDINNIAHDKERGVKNEKGNYRLKGLFNMTDINKDNQMSVKEFIYCLSAVKLDLNEDEMRALFVQADKDDSGFLSFAEFAYFFEANLAGIVRANHMKSLYSTLHDKSSTINAVGGEAEQLKQLKDLEDHLAYVYKTVETEGAGKLEKNDIQTVLDQIDVELSDFQKSTILGEMFADEEGFVDIPQAVTVTAHLLQVFLADEGSSQSEDRAAMEASRVVKLMAKDIHRIVRFFMNGIHEIDNNALLTESDRTRQLEYLVHSQYSGLAPTEANHLMHTLFNEAYRTTRKKAGHADEALIDAVKSTSKDLEANSDRVRARRVTLSASNIFSKDSNSKNGSHATPEKTPDFDQIEHEEDEHSRINSSESEAKVHHEQESSGRLPGRTARSTIVNMPTKANAAGAHPGQPPEQKRIQPRRKTIVAKKNWTPKEQDLTNAIARAKQETIMRAQVQSLDGNAASKAILSAMLQAKEILVMQGLVDVESNYLPVRNAYEILSDGWHFRLGHSNIMALIVFSNCFDRTDMNIDLRKFSAYAGGAIKNNHNPVYLEKRAHVIEKITHELQDTNRKAHKHATFGDLAISEEELDNYLLHAFLKAEDSRGEVNQQDFIRILKGTPGVVLTTRDAVAIGAGFPHTKTTGSVHWQKFAPWAFLAISSLCMEHMIKRRMTLVELDEEDAFSNEHTKADRVAVGSGALGEMTKLAENAIELLKVRHIVTAPEEGADCDAAFDSILALFPFDIEDSIATKNSEILEEDFVPSLDSLSIEQGKDGSNTLLHCEDNISISASMVVATPKPVHRQSARGGTTLEPKVPVTPATRKGASSLEAKAIDSVIANFFVSAVENPHTIDRELKVIVEGEFAYEAQGKAGTEVKRVYKAELDQNISMPSMCLIDPDAAAEFAATLSDQVLLEFTSDGSAAPRLLLKCAQFQ